VDDTALLELKVSKHQQKLEQAASVVSMTRDRLASSEKADKESRRELKSLEAALKSAKKKAKQL
jgi:hypothetical protein